jgi:hypothetical protein
VSMQMARREVKQSLHFRAFFLCGI